jgi:methyl-accepting chemotaxis protein
MANMLKTYKFGIGRKLSLGYGILMLFILINVVLTVTTSLRNVNLNKVISEVYTPTEANINGLSNEIVNSKMLIKNWVFVDKKPDTPDKRKLKELQEKNVPDIFVNLDKLSSSEEWSAQEKEIYARIKKAITDTLIPEQQKIMASLKDFSSYDDPSIKFNVEPMVEEGGPLMIISDNILTNLKNILDSQQTKAKEARESMNRSLSRVITIVLITGIILLAVALVVAFLTTVSIVRPIRKGVEFAKSIGKGELNATVDIDQQDEIGELAEALKEMAGKLRDIIVRISESSKQIASTGEEMNTRSQQLSQGASDQASSTEEVSSSMEEMVSNIQQNTENAQQTEKIALTASSGINSVIQAANDSVNSIKTIAEKISIVNDIAFQTNILALNAAVEAARAGEHGRGFAVVAAEVRKLAERSKGAADEIQVLAKTSVTNTDEAGRLLYDIAPEIEKTAKLVQEITAASIEQNAGVEQINTSIQQLNHVTQQNALVSDEISKNSKTLHNFADELRDIISYFKFDKEKEKGIKTITSKSNSFDKAAKATPEKQQPVEKVKLLEKVKEKAKVTPPAETPAQPKKKISERNITETKHKVSSRGINLNMHGEETSDSEYEKF